MQDIANIACAVYHHSLEQPDSTALVFQNESTSYADLVRAAARLAHGFIRCVPCKSKLERLKNGLG